MILLLIINLLGCQTATPDADQTEQEVRSDTQLVLNNAILEQSNKQENTVWKIKADNIVYSEDNQTAVLDQVVGNLWQNGAVILKISAKTGEIIDNGNIIFLNREVILNDPRNGSVINSDAVEWRPQENLLLIKEKVTGNHPNLKLTAESGTYLTDVEQLEIQGNVIATTKHPSLQLTSDRLKWNIAQNLVESPEAIKLVRFGKDQTITEKLVSDRAKVDLVDRTATLNHNVELVTADPQLQIASDLFVWNYQQRVGISEQPIQILDRDRQISLTGNKGEIDLQQQLAKLQDGVKGINRQKDSQLYARQLTWKIDREEVEATGNVIYQQLDPKARLTGEKAVGTLSNNNIVVTSEGKEQVTTVIDN